jgi:hypothetical protein
MNVGGSVKYLAAVVVAGICSACGFSPAAAPPNPSVLPGYATIVPDRRAKSKDFEYFSNDYGTYAGIFGYPKSDRQIGTINNVGGQACTNVLYGYGKKIVWLIATEDQITEYEVPQTPIKTLSLSSFGQPSGCAMDTSGDLAVVIGNGDIVIFKDATGSGTVITTSLASVAFIGYDPHGNLFADGYNGSSKFALVELPRGKSKWRSITTSNTAAFPGSVQWTASTSPSPIRYRTRSIGTKSAARRRSWRALCRWIPATARRRGSLRALSFARMQGTTMAKFSNTRPAAHPLPSSRAISTCRSA